MVGHIGFHQPPEDGSLEMGYSVFAEYQRQGIAHEAAQTLMEWARREHGHPAVRGVCVAGERAVAGTGREDGVPQDRRAVGR